MVVQYCGNDKSYFITAGGKLPIYTGRETLTSTSSLLLTAQSLVHPVQHVQVFTLRRVHLLETFLIITRRHIDRSAQSSVITPFGDYTPTWLSAILSFGDYIALKQGMQLARRYNIRVTKRGGISP